MTRRAEDTAAEEKTVEAFQSVLPKSWPVAGSGVALSALPDEPDEEGSNLKCGP